MSQQHAKDFLTELDNDSELYDQVAKIRDKMQVETIALAKSHGFEITPAEVKAALEDVHGALPGPDEDGADPSTCMLPFSETPG